MAVKKSMQQAEIDLNVSTAQVEWSVGRAITGTVQLTAKDQTASTAVVTLYRSNDGFGWVALEGAGVTLGPDDAMTDEIDLSGFLFLAARVTTAEGSAQMGTLTLCTTEEV